MPFLNPGHMWLIILLLIVVLIIWGPGKLPDVGAGMGRAIREFRNATHEVTGAAVQATDTSSPNGRAGESSSAAPAPAAERTDKEPSLR
jgi:TatA/E family protein of Tat protein translocase